MVIYRPKNKRAYRWDKDLLYEFSIDKRYFPKMVKVTGGYIAPFASEIPLEHAIGINKESIYLCSCVITDTIPDLYWLSMYCQDIECLTNEFRQLVDFCNLNKLKTEFKQANYGLVNGEICYYDPIKF